VDAFAAVDDCNFDDKLMICASLAGVVGERWEMDAARIVL